MFFEEPSGPLIQMKGEDFSNPNCQFSCGGCDLVRAMRYVRYTNMESPPAKVYWGKLVCHGLREMTDDEKADAQAFNLDSTTPVCDLEVIVGRDF